MIAELERLLRAIAAVEGVTSAAGTVNTVVDAARVEGVDYWNGRTIVLLTGAANGQASVIVDDNGAGTLTVRPALSAAPGATQPYIILNRISDMVPTADSDENYQTRDVIGNKTDAAALDTMADLATDTLVAEVKRVLLRMSTDAFTATIQGFARTELDIMMAQMAIYFNAAGAALSVVSQPGVAARTNLNDILTDLADILAGAGITNFPAAAAPADGVSIAEVLRQIYNDLAAVETKLDAGGLGKGLVTKALTFANQTGQVPLFTVTGDVIVRLVAVVKTNCGSAGGCNVSVGIAADVDAIIPVTDITLLAAQEIWFDATPDSEIEALGTMREHIISDGNDITLNSSAADNSGAITFYCFWTALSAGAIVVAA